MWTVARAMSTYRITRCYTHHVEHIAVRNAWSNLSTGSSWLHFHFQCIGVISWWNQILFYSSCNTKHSNANSNWNDICVMRGSKQCIVDQLHGEDTVNWIVCSSCSSWYHDACVGICVNALPNSDFVFSCCSHLPEHSSQPIPMSVLWQRHWFFNDVTVASRVDNRLRLQLCWSDVTSLYHNNGLSDGVIDFFLKYVNFIFCQ